MFRQLSKGAKALSSWAERRWAWALLAGSALALDLTALFFQYGMNLTPCMMCVYERLAITGIIFAGIIGSIQPTNMWCRLSAYSLWGWCWIKGLLVAIEHVEIQFPDNPFVATCGFNAEFWLPLDEWLPALFAPTGLCDEIQWVFLGWTMPQWLIVVFAGFGVVWLALGLSRLLIAKKP